MKLSQDLLIKTSKERLAKTFSHQDQSSRRPATKDPTKTTTAAPPMSKMCEIIESSVREAVEFGQLSDPSGRGGSAGGSQPMYLTHNAAALRGEAKQLWPPEQQVESVFLDEG